MNDDEKIRVTMTEDDLWHLYITMDGLCAAGSMNDDDRRLALLLARALARRGMGCPGVDAWLMGDRFGDEP